MIFFIRSLFRLLRHASEPQFIPCIGQARLALKDVPASGHAKWCDLYDDRRQKIKANGRVLIQAELSQRPCDCTINGKNYHWTKVKFSKKMFSYKNKSWANNANMTQWTL